MFTVGSSSVNRIHTIDLYPGLAFPYFNKQFKPLRSARAQICNQSSSASADANSVATLVKNKQYNAPDVPPISSSAMYANSEKTDEGCDK